MAQPFTLELPQGLKWVIHPPWEPYGEDPIRTAAVEIQADGLVARTTATLYSEGTWNLAAFFKELAADWRGWAGERHWTALEGEMAIDAWHMMVDHR